MQEPETFKRPRLYMRIVNSGRKHDKWIYRIRIIWPSGRVWWDHAGKLDSSQKDRPCWATDKNKMWQEKNPYKLVEMMKDFDLKCKQETEFVCEL